MNIDNKLKEEFKKLGLHLKSLRESKGLTLNELSEETGIRKEYLMKIEDGNAYGLMLNRHILKIIKVLKISFYEFFDY